MTIIMALAAMLMVTSFVSARKTGDDTLTSLWKKYERAGAEDRIQDMADILEDVKEAALKGKAPWNYIKASEEYVSVMSRRNWKLTDSLLKSLENIPEELGAEYPAVPYLRYRKINDGGGGIEELQKLASDYAGRGIALLAEDEILAMRFYEMEGKASSDDYVEYEKEVLAFRKKLGGLKGDEGIVAEMCNNYPFILEQLRSVGVTGNIDAGKLTLALRNLKKVTVRIMKGKDAVFETELLDERGSFYRRDTVYARLPVLPDGDYAAEILDGDKLLGTLDYEKFTISMARRFASGGMCIYAADYMTGKPLVKADLLVYDNDGKLVGEFEDFEFNGGYTALPKEIYPFRDKESYSIVCRSEEDGLVRLSRRMHLRNEECSETQSPLRLKALVMKDRAAFVPGDTVRFKAILYEVHPDGSMRTLPAGYETLAKLYDPKMDMVSEISLKTNEFGSVSADFVLNKEWRNGNYQIRIHDGKKILGSGMFKLDDFVLPTYDLSFDREGKLYFPGDQVKVSGRIRNFTGHGFDGLRAVAEIQVKNIKTAEKPVPIAPDGSFTLSFKAGDPEDDYVSYGVIIRLIDSTGETLSFDWHSRVGSYISLDATLCNSNSRDAFGIKPGRDRHGRFTSGEVLGEKTAKIHFWASGYGSEMADMSIDYELKHEGRTVRKGSARSDDTLSIDMSDLVSGLYDFEMRALAETDSGVKVKGTKTCTMLYLPNDAKLLTCEIDRVFRCAYKDGEVLMQLGSGTGPLWAVAELFGEGNKVLKKEMIYLEGKAGEPGSLHTLTFPHLEEYSDNLHLGLTYFRNGQKYYYRRSFSRPEEVRELPLDFVSFTEKALPGQECTFRFKTLPGTEILASVYDLSSEQIMRNLWPPVRTNANDEVYVNYSWATGCNGGHYNIMVKTYGAAAKAEVSGMAMRSNAMMADAVVEDEPVPFQLVAGGTVPQIEIRDDFSTTLAFEPYIKPAADGSAELKLRTSDKLSTFIVKLFAHDKSMNNAVTGREILVSLPVKLSVQAPQYLYAGDKYVLNASVSNVSAVSLKGSVYLELYDGDEYLDVEPVRIDSSAVSVPVGGVSTVAFEVEVPETVNSLGLKLVFDGHEHSDDAPVNDVLYSDAVFVPVPVYPAAQILTEAHSALVPGVQSVEEVVAKLRGEFVNLSHIGAEYSELSIMDMIREALPGAVWPEDKNAVSLSEAMYLNLLTADLRASGDDAVQDSLVVECIDAAVESVTGLLACHKADGGFAWFEKGASSALITALVLERYAALRDRGLLELLPKCKVPDDFNEAVVAAVKYLDVSYFVDRDMPLWYGRLSLGQYLNVRSMFTGVEFDETAARKSLGNKGFGEYRRQVKTYLIPKGTETVADMLSKVRMARTIMNLTEGTPESYNLRKAWGLSSNLSVKRMIKSRDRELRSLKQYAVEHPSGGFYYPNAVMPWRGLLESEAYAHARICDLFRDAAASHYGDRSLDKLADGIRIWLMIQKETQDWGTDPGFVEALSSVAEGSEAVKDTKLVVLKKRYKKPFPEIKSYGNGLRISACFYKEAPDGSLMKLSEGDSLKVGDKLKAVYSLWSSENRSHVRISIPRPACLRPALQLSGWSGGWLRPISYGKRRISPYSYREVKADRTLWWVDVFPEEDTVLEESFFVTQQGSFAAPAAEIESLYAPHYRANAEMLLLEISK